MEVPAQMRPAGRLSELRDAISSWGVELAIAPIAIDGADLRGADLGGLWLVDASLFRSATISREQAGQLLSELGLNLR